MAKATSSRILTSILPVGGAGPLSREVSTNFAKSLAALADGLLRLVPPKNLRVRLIAVAARAEVDVAKSPRLSRSDSAAQRLQLLLCGGSGHPESSPRLFKERGEGFRSHDALGRPAFPLCRSRGVQGRPGHGQSRRLGIVSSNMVVRHDVKGTDVYLSIVIISEVRRVGQHVVLSSAEVAADADPRRTSRSPDTRRHAARPSRPPARQFLQSALPSATPEGCRTSKGTATAFADVSGARGPASAASGAVQGFSLQALSRLSGPGAVPRGSSPALWPPGGFEWPGRGQRAHLPTLEVRPWVSGRETRLRCPDQADFGPETARPSLRKSVTPGNRTLAPQVIGMEKSCVGASSHSRAARSSCGANGPLRGSLNGFHPDGSFCTGFVWEFIIWGATPPA
eukprot:scaffold1616_cov310-Pinguiococcus_pyrenoidosus.AAC.7